MFDYFYGTEGNQYSFLVLPKTLIKDERFKKLSASAIILYCLFLERNTLSQKNGWFDEEDRAYIIYTRDQIMEDMNCSVPTAAKLVDELARFGLITKVRRGLGKPDIIYVKNFNREIEEESADFQEVKEINFQKIKNLTFGSQELLPQEVREFDPNNTKNNKLNRNYPDLESSSSSPPADQSRRRALEEDEEETHKRRIGYYEAIKLYPPAIVNGVLFALMNRDRSSISSISRDVFLAICRNIVDYSGGSINNLPSYIEKCVNNMFLAMSAAVDQPKTGKARSQWSGGGMSRSYSAEEFADIERDILSNQDRSG
ncbi:MAG: replication initiator protein A [Lachnospiraceae bacterium]|nr:replication initiator protein A [Lachnospiraceae bacterium]